MRLKLILIVGAIATAVFAAGCGGGGSTSGDTTAAGGGNASTAKSEAASESKPLTKTELSTRIDEICIQVPRTYEEELKKLEKKIGKKPSKSESNVKAAIPPLESAIEQMEEVTPPASEEQHLEEVTAALQSAAKGIEEDPTSELSGPKSPFAEFQKLTKEYGFEGCSGL